jgi:hypothetical protein
MDLAGLGVNALRMIPVDTMHRIDVAALRDAISRDHDAGLEPFLVVGSAGTVDVGAVDVIGYRKTGSRAPNGMPGEWLIVRRDSRHATPHLSLFTMRAIYQRPDHIHQLRTRPDSLCNLQPTDS